MINKMNVKELMVALKECGMDMNRTKTVLVIWLNKGAVNGAAVVRDRPAIEAENNIVDDFSAGGVLKAPQAN